MDIRQIDRHVDSMTDPAQRAESVKIQNYIDMPTVRNTRYDLRILQQS